VADQSEISASLGGGAKDASQKMQFVGAIKKVASLVPWRQNAKWKTSKESTGPK